MFVEAVPCTALMRCTWCITTPHHTTEVPFFVPKLLHTTWKVKEMGHTQDTQFERSKLLNMRTCYLQPEDHLFCFWTPYHACVTCYEH